MKIVQQMIPVRLKPKVAHAIKFDIFNYDISRYRDYVEHVYESEDCGFEYRNYNYYYLKNTSRQRIYNGWWLVLSLSGEWYGYDEKTFWSLYEVVNNS